MRESRYVHIPAIQIVTSLLCIGLAGVAAAQSVYRDAPDSPVTGVGLPLGAGPKRSTSADVESSVKSALDEYLLT